MHADITEIIVDIIIACVHVSGQPSVVSMVFSSSRSRRRFFCPVDMKSTILERHRFKAFQSAF